MPHEEPARNIADRPGTLREAGRPVDFAWAESLTPDVDAAIDNAFEYHPWDEDQRAAGKLVRNALATAVKVIVSQAPRSATRTRAINMCLDARMLANAAITFQGRH